MFLGLRTHWLLILGRRWMSSGAWNRKVMRMINQIPSSKGCHVPASVLDNPLTWESEAGLCPEVFGIRVLTSVFGVNWEGPEVSFGMVSLLHYVTLPRFACDLLGPCSFSYGKYGEHELWEMHLAVETRWPQWWASHMESHTQWLSGDWHRRRYMGNKSIDSWLIYLSTW